MRDEGLDSVIGFLATIVWSPDRDYMDYIRVLWG